MGGVPMERDEGVGHGRKGEVSKAAQISLTEKARSRKKMEMGAQDMAKKCRRVFTSKTFPRKKFNNAEMELKMAIFSPKKFPIFQPDGAFDGG